MKILIFASVKIMTVFISYTLSFLILLSSLRVSITYAYYELDPVGFIEKLCENKDKPELQCNGQCHLKKVAESSSKDSKSPEKVINFDELLLFIKNPDSFEININNYKSKKRHNYLNLYAYVSTYIFEHPPQFKSHFSNNLL